MSAAALVGILCAVAALLFVLAPLLWPGAFGVRDAGATDAEGESLERLRDDLYARIVELDFDREVGKTDEEEYRQERADLKRQALAVLRLLDERDGRAATAVLAAPAVSEAIEREVAAARRARAAAVGAGDGGLEDEVEREVRALRRARRSDPGGERVAHSARPVGAGALGRGDGDSTDVA